MHRYFIFQDDETSSAMDRAKALIYEYNNKVENLCIAFGDAEGVAFEYGIPKGFIFARPAENVPAGLVKAPRNSRLSTGIKSRGFDVYLPDESEKGKEIARRLDEEVGPMRSGKMCLCLATGMNSDYCFLPDGGSMYYVDEVLADEEGERFGFSLIPCTDTDAFEKADVLPNGFTEIKEAEWRIMRMNPYCVPGENVG